MRIIDLSKREDAAQDLLDEIDRDIGQLTERVLQTLQGLDEGSISPEEADDEADLLELGIKEVEALLETTQRLICPSIPEKTRG